jgi:hypothetical protein
VEGSAFFIGVIMENHPFNKIKSRWGDDAVDWDRIEHFDPEEFDDPDHPGSWIHMNPLSIIKLNRLRHKTGWPIITHNKFGLHGCVCVEPEGHSEKSRHYVENKCDAVDWHFDTDADPRVQAMMVWRSEFTGIGIYYDQKWPNKEGKSEALPVAFHTDLRKRPQVWKRENGEYIYLLK